MQDRIAEQELEIADWQDSISAKLKTLQEEKYPEFSIYAFGKAFAYRQFSLQLYRDSRYFILAVILTFCFILHRVGAFWVGYHLDDGQRLGVVASCNPRFGRIRNVLDSKLNNSIKSQNGE